MSRDVKVDNASSGMGEDHKDEQDFKPNRVAVKKSMEAS